MNITVLGSRSLLRAGLVSLLSTIGFESIEDADDINHLRSRTGIEPRSDMLILCLVRSAEDVTPAEREISAWEPTARIVFVVPKFDLDIMIECFAVGGCAYLLETISRDALRESLMLVRAGEKVFPSELASLIPTLMSKLGSPETHNLAPLESELSRREIEILQCLITGQSNKVIAKNLEIAEATVKVHVKRILRKAHVINRTQAALWGVATGIGSLKVGALDPQLGPAMRNETALKVGY
jgi:two-component system, NarL family, nitrate/nitrite response regulator NarL